MTIKLVLSRRNDFSYVVLVYSRKCICKIGVEREASKPATLLCHEL